MAKVTLIPLKLQGLHLKWAKVHKNTQKCHHQPSFFDGGAVIGFGELPDHQLEIADVGT